MEAPARFLRNRTSKSLVMSAMLGGLVLVPAAASAAPSGSGTIEVCKSNANGMTGQSFNFLVKQPSGSFSRTISVAGGGCSGPISAPAGSIRVHERASAGSEVQSISVTPSSRVRSQPSSSSVMVDVVGGSGPSNETLVTFTNQPTGGTNGGLKVCKVAADNALVGQPFSFTENGGPAFSVRAGTAGSPNCGPVDTFQNGTVVNLRELANTGTHVSNITVSNGRGSNFNLNNGSVTATVGSGVTVVTFTNSVNVTTAKGFIEVCKEASGPFLTGTFEFSITAPGFSRTESGVMPGQCTSPIQVPAGNVSVTEGSRANVDVVAIGVQPSNRTVSQNTTNRTVTVTVPAADSSNETLVTFFNQARTGQVKICKTLTSNSGDIAGSTFTFDVNSRAAGSQGPITVVAGSAGSTACKFLPQALPIGDLVTISERGTANVQLVSVSVSPGANDRGSSGNSAVLEVSAGITTATFTNQALGTIEVCKRAADSSTATQSFQFSVNGGQTFSVRAGQCSQPMQVPAGTATVLELDKANFTFVNVSAVGPNGQDRLIRGGNPATVSVPFGGVSNETVVTFTNRVNTAAFKICKVSSSSRISNVPFTFTYQVNGGSNQTAVLRPGECSGLTTVAVVDANGNAPTVTIKETATPGTFVQSITADGSGTLTAKDEANGTATLRITGSGFATVTYDNEEDPFGGNAARFSI